MVLIFGLWYYYHKHGGQNSSCMTPANQHHPATVFIVFSGSDLLLGTMGITQ